jgi:hypothetical protein
MDRFVRREMLICTEVKAAFVRVQSALASDVVHHDLLQVGLVGDWHREGADVAAIEQGRRLHTL